MVNLKISLYGECLEVKELLLSDVQRSEWNTIATKKKMPLKEALLDPFFYHSLNDKKVKSINDINCVRVAGLINNNKNQIEIWHKRKKILKLKINDLRSDFLLFPLYTTEYRTAHFNNDAIYFISKEIGLVAQFEIKLEKFDISHLKFKFASINDSLLLEGISYNNLNLNSTKNDTIINQQYIIEK